MKIQRNARILAMFVIALVLLAGIGGISFFGTMRMASDMEWVKHTHEVGVAIEKLLEIVGRDGMSHRGYLITGDEAFLANHGQSLLDMDAAMERLRGLVTDNPSQQARVAALSGFLTDRLKLSSANVEIRREQGFEAVQKVVMTRKGEAMLNEIYGIGAQLMKEEAALLPEREIKSQASARMTERVIVFGSVMAFTLVGGALWCLKREQRVRQKSEQARRESEERFRSIFHDAAIPTEVSRPDGCFIKVNRAFCELVGYSEAELLGMTFVSITHPEDQKPLAVDLLHHVMGSRMSTFRTEKRYLHKGGAVVWADLSISVVRGSDGQPLYFIAHAQDITERKRIEEELRQFTSQLEARVRERTQFLESAMAELREEVAERRRLEEEILQISEREQMRIGQDLHDDLGQQLSGIAMLAQVLANRLQSEFHPMAPDALQLKTYLTGSISTTRSIAKSLYPVELESGGLIFALRDFAHRTLKLTGIDCSVRVDESFHVEESAGIHLYRIVQESVGNAIKHGEATRIVIDCRAHEGLHTLTVTDNGRGFVPSEEDQWTGMGLRIFQYRARLIGAQIAVGPGKEGGCQVICSMPVSPRKKAPLPCLKTTTSAVSSSSMITP